MLPAMAMRAPADLPDGKRSLRAPFACLATLGALAALMSVGAADEGVWSGGARTVEYRLDGPSWTGPTLVGVALALALAAVLLWAARRRLLFALGAALPLLALAVGIFAYSKRQSEGRISNDEARAVELGISRAEVTRRLGAPAGHGTMRIRHERLGCLMYTTETTDRPSGPISHAFCFRDGRLAVRESV
jgi:hypothetical protein